MNHRRGMRLNSIFFNRWRHSCERSLCRRSGDDRSLIDFHFKRRNIVGGEFFDHRFGCGHTFFLGWLNAGFDLGAEFIQFGLIAGQSLELGEGCHGLGGHAMSGIETDLVNGLVGFAGLRNFISGGGVLHLGFCGFCFLRCGTVSLDRDGVIPLRGEVDFSSPGRRFVGCLRLRLAGNSELGMSRRFDIKFLSMRCRRGPWRSGW